MKFDYSRKFTNLKVWWIKISCKWYVLVARKFILKLWTVKLKFNYFEISIILENLKFYKFGKWCLGYYVKFIN